MARPPEKALRDITFRRSASFCKRHCKGCTKRGADKHSRKDLIWFVGGRVERSFNPKGRVGTSKKALGFELVNKIDGRPDDCYPKRSDRILGRVRREACMHQGGRVG
jgi:hypothetical protein